MAISPLGNIVHVNQNMQVQSAIQGNAQNRVDLQNFVNMQDFNEKLQEVEDVRPAEQIHKVDEEGGGGKNEQEMKKKEETEEEMKKEEEEEKNPLSSSPFHILDIQV